MNALQLVENWIQVDIPNTPVIDWTCPERGNIVIGKKTSVVDPESRNS